MAKKYIPSSRKYAHLSAEEIRRAAELREKHGLTYAAIARRFGISAARMAELIRKHQEESTKAA